MRDINLFPVDFGSYLVGYPGVRTKADVILNDTNLRLSGRLFKAPGGHATISLLAERREQRAKQSLLTYYDDGMESVVYSFRPPRAQKVDSAYGEVRVPVFSSENAIPFFNRLELQGSVRHDQYRTISANPATFDVDAIDATLPTTTMVTNRVKATRYTVGATWAPVRDLQLRGSYATAFLPPSIHQIVPDTPATTFAFITDDRRGGTQELISFRLTSGGNPDLLPEDSRTWSLGAILTPRFLPGLRLSADYINIRKTDEIVGLNFAELIDNEELYPGKVTRAALTPEDVAEGFTGGAVTEVNAALVNATRTEVEAIDFQGDYTVNSDRFGDFRAYVVATWQIALRRQPLPTAPLLNQVGFSNGVLKWRGNGGLTWAKDGLGVSWNAQYFDKYRVDLVGTEKGAETARTVNQGSYHIPRQIYHDIAFNYRVGPEGALGNPALSDVTVGLGIQNVFDKRPPVLATLEPTGGYSTYGDPRLRRFTLSVRKGF